MNQQEASKQNWSTQSVTSATIEEINSGSLQRIATAVELMSYNYQKLIIDRDMYERWWKEQRDKHAKAQRKISALQGHITRLKNKMKAMEAQAA